MTAFVVARNRLTEKSLYLEMLGAAPEYVSFEIGLAQFQSSQHQDASA